MRFFFSGPFVIMVNKWIFCITAKLKVVFLNTSQHLNFSSLSGTLQKDCNLCKYMSTYLLHSHSYFCIICIFYVDCNGSCLFKHSTFEFLSKYFKWLWQFCLRQWPTLSYINDNGVFCSSHLFIFKMQMFQNFGWGCRQSILLDFRLKPFRPSKLHAFQQGEQVSQKW